MFVKTAETAKERNDAFYVRKKVFVDEQHIPTEVEIDQHEEDAVHFVLYNEQKEPIGAGRYRVINGLAKAERICVLGNSRKNGAGASIMEAIEKHASERQLKQIKLSAQAHAIPFYERLDYRTISEEYVEQNTPHKMMIKDL